MKNFLERLPQVSKIPDREKLEVGKFYTLTFWIPHKVNGIYLGDEGFNVKLSDGGTHYIPGKGKKPSYRLMRKDRLFKADEKQAPDWLQNKYERGEL